MRLLRPVGDRQDDAVGRPAAEPHRRRRARLGRRTGVFNFEGGCYAKTIRLSPMYEPDIFATTRRFGTILENVDLDPRDARARPRLGAVHREHPRRLPARLHRQRRPDRASPASPRNVVFLTADAFGVLPPITPADPRAGRLPLHQRLHRQARRHRGRRQGAEGDVLGLLRGAVHAAPPGRVRARCWSSGSSAYDVPVWLVNTGWTGGPYGTGERMNIDHTRIDGPGGARRRARRRRRRSTDPIFGVAVPTSVPGRARARSSQPRDDVGRPRAPTTRQAAASSPRCSAENFAALRRTASSDDDRAAAGPRIEVRRRTHGDIARRPIRARARPAPSTATPSLEFDRPQPRSPKES